MRFDALMHTRDAIHRHPTLRELDRVELEVMRLDGEVQRHGIAGFEFYLPIGVVPTLDDRVASLAPLARPGRVFRLETARWLHLGGPAPRRISISRSSGRRPSTLPPVVEWAFRRIPEHDRCELGRGVAATTLERTERDLAADARDGRRPPSRER